MRLYIYIYINIYNIYIYIYIYIYLHTMYVTNSRALNQDNKKTKYMSLKL